MKLLHSAIAVITALSLCSAFGAETLDSQLSTLSQTLAAKIKDSGRKKVTVLDFTDLEGKKVTQFGRYIAEQLTVNLDSSKKEFTIVDRANLKRILDEHKLTVSGLVDPENAKKLGQISGVDALILGTVADLPNSVKVFAKIIATDTADVAGSGECRVTKDDEVKYLLGRGIESGGDASSEGGYGATSGGSAWPKGYRPTRVVSVPDPSKSKQTEWEEVLRSGDDIQLNIASGWRLGWKFGSAADPPDLLDIVVDYGEGYESPRKNTIVESRRVARIRLKSGIDHEVRIQFGITTDESQQSVRAKNTISEDAKEIAGVRIKVESLKKTQFNELLATFIFQNTSANVIGCAIPADSRGFVSSKIVDREGNDFSLIYDDLAGIASFREKVNLTQINPGDSVNVTAKYRQRFANPISAPLRVQLEAWIVAAKDGEFPQDGLRRHNFVIDVTKLR